MSWLANVARRLVSTLDPYVLKGATQPKVSAPVRIEQRFLQPALTDNYVYLAASEEVDRYTAWLTDNGPEKYLDYSYRRHKELDEGRL